MKVIFRTNLDLYSEEWPSLSNGPWRPVVGDSVQSLTSWRNGFQLTLEVVDVTWKSLKCPNESYLEVELHLPKGRGETIGQFQERYRNLTRGY